MTPHFAPVLDLHLATYEAGDPTGPPLLFLHGNSLAADLFVRQFEAAELQSFRMVAFDLPGHGQSPAAPAYYRLGAMRAVVLEAMRALGMEQALAVGHSYGGNLLLELLPQLPALQGLLALTPPVSTSADLAAAFPADDIRPLFYTETVTRAQATAMAYYALRPQAAAADVARLEAAVQRSDGRARSELLASIGELGDEVGHVAQAAVPLAFATGVLDATVRPQYFDALRVPSRWGPPLHAVPDAGHSPFLENPAEFNALLLAFHTATKR